MACGRRPRHLTLSTLLLVLVLGAIPVVAARPGIRSTLLATSTAGVYLPLVLEASAFSRIAFTSDRDGNAEIYVMNADGSGRTNLTNTPNDWESDPVWSPDGSKLAFASNDIYVMNAGGSGQTNLTDTPTEGESPPVWSP